MSRNSDIEYKMPFRGKWMKWTESDLDRWLRAGGKSADYADLLVKTYMNFTRNRFAYFLPHCDGAAFINDRENHIVLLTKGNQFGGTCHGVAFSIARITECDPNWMCFTHHGLKWHPFEGAKRWLIATSIWEIMSDAVWPEYQKLLPRYELGQYAPNFGDPDMYPDEAKTGLPAKNLTFKDGRTKRLTLLKSGSTLIFSCYSQPQDVFESRQFDGGHLDEQIKQGQFDGFDERGRTRRNWQACITVSGVKIKGRPDTGKGQWMHTKLYLGRDTKGRKVGRYKLWADGVPDALYSKESKAQAYKKWVENPKKTHDLAAIREGEARWFGGWEGSSGMVIPNWNERVHLIAPFDVPKDWTRYRAIDHGITKPTACLWMAVTPWEDYLIYREYYEPNLVIAKHCENIVKLSGNIRQKLDSYIDIDINMQVELFMEQFTNETYFSSVLDARSFASRSSERDAKLGQLYNDYGLSCTPAKPENLASMLPKIKALFDPQQEKKHFIWELNKRKLISQEQYERWLALRNGNEGDGCRLYVFDNLTNFQTEITGWEIDEKTDKPVKENDHLMACMRYLIAESPVYFGEDWNEREDQNLNQTREELTGTRFTGYG